MKKIILLVLLIPQVLSAQKSNDFFQADLSVGFGIYNSFDNLNGNYVRQKFNAFARISQLNLSFKVKDQFYIGFEGRGKKFAGQNDSTIYETANSVGLLINTDYQFINKNKINAYLGFGLGISGLNYSKTIYGSDSLGIHEIQEGKIRGGGGFINLRSGIRWYFTKNIGLSLLGNYSITPTQIRSFKINGADQEIIGYKNIDDVVVNFRGIELKLGVCIRF